MGEIWPEELKADPKLIDFEHYLDGVNFSYDNDRVFNEILDDYVYEF